MTLTPHDTEKRILNLLKTRILSVSQVAKELDIGRGIAAGYMEALRNQGKLDFHRVGRSNVYMVRGAKR